MPEQVDQLRFTREVIDGWQKVFRQRRLEREFPKRAEFFGRIQENVHSLAQRHGDRHGNLNVHLLVSKPFCEAGERVHQFGLAHLERRREKQTKDREKPRDFVRLDFVELDTTGTRPRAWRRLDIFIHDPKHELARNNPNADLLTLALAAELVAPGNGRVISAEGYQTVVFGIPDGLPDQSRDAPPDEPSDTALAA